MKKKIMLLAALAIVATSGALYAYTSQKSSCNGACCGTDKCQTECSCDDSCSGSDCDCGCTCCK